jgi:predicted transcriptional regulator
MHLCARITAVEVGRHSLNIEEVPALIVHARNCEATQVAVSKAAAEVPEAMKWLLS